MRLFARIEADLVRAGEQPISLDDGRRAQLERAFVDAWTQGSNPTMESLEAAGSR